MIVRYVTTKGAMEVRIARSYAAVLVLAAKVAAQIGASSYSIRTAA